MGLFNLLDNTVMIGLFGQTYDISLNWIGNLIKGLINGVGVVGVGIILFSLILKAIVLPFDVYQRINMRKQNIKMKENQKRMEKLQKQYANDKEAYNRKLMEMYKESGISVMSSCLPMILSLIVFIAAINGFNAYSQYSSVENYNVMVGAYNKGIQEVVSEMETAGITVTEENDQYTIVVDSILNSDHEELKTVLSQIESDANIPNAEIEQAQQDAVRNYVISKAQDAVVLAYETDVTQNVSFLWIKNIWATDATYKHPVLTYSDFKLEAEREQFIVGDEKKSFADVINAAGSGISPYDEFAYNRITGKLGAQKEAPNGYYILILLSIGTILLQQVVSMRSQKEQQKYSSVDGQGATQQKTMLVVMTVMFAVFSFMYSAAFSIYMIMSNVLSLFSTLIINKIVDVVADKREEKAIQEKYNKRFPGKTANAANHTKNDKRK